MNTDAKRLYAARATGGRRNGSADASGLASRIARVDRLATIIRIRGAIPRAVFVNFATAAKKFRTALDAKFVSTIILDVDVCVHHKFPFPRSSVAD